MSVIQIVKYPHCDVSYVLKLKENDFTEFSKKIDFFIMATLIFFSFFRVYKMEVSFGADLSLRGLNVLIPTTTHFG